MPIPVAAIAAWVSIAERVVVMWQRLKNKGGAAMENVKQRFRKRPTTPVVACILAASMMASGCATLGKLDMDEIETLCTETYPCEPCPPCDKKHVEDTATDVTPKPDPKPEGDSETEKPAEADSPIFVWKPIADTAPVLYIVTPAQLDCDSVWLKTRRGVKEVGVYRGPRANGNRQHWGFKKKGQEYGKDITVTCELSNGKEKVWKIPNGAKRFEGR